MEATEDGQDVATVLGQALVEGVAAATESGVDILSATYNANPTFRTVDVTAGYRSQPVQ